MPLIEQEATIPFFAGPMRTVDSVLTEPYRCQDCLNVQFEDGGLSPRYGLAALKAPQAGFTNVRGFDYLAGYTGSYTLAEEFVAIEKVSGTVKPWSYNPSTWDRTEITNGGVALSLSDASTPNWGVVKWQDKAYFYSRLGALYRHTIGTTNTFTSLSQPADPTTQLVVTVTNVPVQVDLSGIDATASGELACTGYATNTGSSNAAGALLVAHTTGNGASSFEIDLVDGPGKLDLNRRDFIFFRMVGQINGTGFDPNSLSVLFTNDDVAPNTKTFTPKIEFIKKQVRYKEGATQDIAEVRLDMRGRTRADWGDDNGTGKTAKIKVSYNSYTNAKDANKWLYFYYPTVGYIDMLPADISDPTNRQVELGYTAYDSTNDMESDVGGIYKLSMVELIGGDKMNPLTRCGAWIVMTAAQSSVDKLRFYMKDQLGAWRRLNTQLDGNSGGSNTYTCKLDHNEVLACTSYTVRAFETTRKIVCAGVFRGSVVWGYEGGYQNIRYSRTSNPEAQWSITDELDDLDRGATFSLAESFDDQPHQIFGVHDSCIIIGARGVYFQVGDRPSNLGPPARVHGAPGGAGANCGVVWKDTAGIMAVAYVSSTGEVYSIAVTPQGISAQHLTADLRGMFQDVLATPQSLLWSGVRAVYLESQDELWFYLGNRAACFRQPSLVTGERYWTFAQYNLNSSTVAYAVSTHGRSTKLITASGYIRESEWSTASSAFVEGELRDAGYEMPEGYWESPEFVGHPARLDLMHIDEVSPSTREITVESTRQTQTYQKKIDRKFVRTSPFQSGHRHSVKFLVTEETPKLRRVSWRFRPAGTRLNA